MTSFRRLGMWLSTLLVGCGAPAAPVTAPAAVRAPEADDSHEEPAVAVVAATAAPAKTAEAGSSKATKRELPANCADSTACYPPRAFTEAVCKHKYPDLPLYLFAARMPWRHLYVKAEWVEPVNPHGGEQSEAWMYFGEEVLLLRKQAQGGGKGIQISGPSDVDVLRWDGTCATIREEQLVSYVPAKMQSPRIIWKYLDAGLQAALLERPQVSRARDEEKKSCRDSSVTHPTPRCDKAMRQLTDAVVLAVRQDVKLPDTGVVPEWSE